MNNYLGCGKDTTLDVLSAIYKYVKSRINATEISSLKLILNE
jgi:hypothetical protein